MQWPPPAVEVSIPPAGLPAHCPGLLQPSNPGGQPDESTTLRVWYVLMRQKLPLVCRSGASSLHALAPPSLCSPWLSARQTASLQPGRLYARAANLVPSARLPAFVPCPRCLVAWVTLSLTAHLNRTSASPSETCLDLCWDFTLRPFFATTRTIVRKRTNTLFLPASSFVVGPSLSYESTSSAFRSPPATANARTIVARPT